MSEKTSANEKPSVVINIDSQGLATILGILTAVSSGESSPAFIEEKIRELQKFVPFLPTALCFMAEAMDRISKAKEKDVANDPAALREFLIHQDMLCRAQGALAALLCVGESLRSEAKKEVSASESPPKKPRKGKRDVKKGSQS
jgi:hypothetical protein